ncbi:hypothetical protein WMY93_004101 [Mugilogobius chulae]|uniref:Uncharacterized protein n=1 Tax=Mugilogobius chulae TaxID=88201 RepID=A0AAW0PMN4_9GOBI
MERMRGVGGSVGLQGPRRNISSREKEPTTAAERERTLPFKSPREQTKEGKSQADTRQTVQKAALKKCTETRDSPAAFHRGSHHNSTIYTHLQGSDGNRIGAG